LSDFVATLIREEFERRQPPLAGVIKRRKRK
jgi:hypothetical protein